MSLIITQIKVSRSRIIETIYKNRFRKTENNSKILKNKIEVLVNCIKNPYSLLYIYETAHSFIEVEVVVVSIGTCSILHRAIFCIGAEFFMLHLVL